MHRGGSGLRRCFRRFAVIAATGALLLPNGPTAHAVPKHRSIARQGDAGTGIPALPIVRHRDAVLTARRTFRWSDLDPSDAWAKDAIDYVGKTHDWMRDFAAKAD